MSYTDPLALRLAPFLRESRGMRTAKLLVEEVGLNEAINIIYDAREFLKAELGARRHIEELGNFLIKNELDMLDIKIAHERLKEFRSGSRFRIEIFE